MGFEAELSIDEGITEADAFDPIPVVNGNIIKFYVKQIKRETEKAWLFEMMSGDTMWLPKSQCKLNNDTDSVVYVPKWLRDKKMKIK